MMTRLFARISSNIVLSQESWINKEGEIMGLAVEDLNLIYE